MNFPKLFILWGQARQRRGIKIEFCALLVVSAEPRPELSPAFSLLSHLSLTFMMNVQHNSYKKGLKGFVSVARLTSVLSYYALEMIGFITFLK